MKTYICIVCGFVYDEAEGRPECAPAMLERRSNAALPEGFRTEVITVLLPFFCFAPAGLMYRCTYAKIFMCILYHVPDYGTNRGYRVAPR